MRTVSTNAALVFAGDVGARLLGFLAVIHIARVLEPENFGVITIGISFLTYAIWFSDLGLTVLGTREIARPYNSRSVQLGDILFLKLTLATVVFIAGQVAVGYAVQNPVLRDVIRIYLFCLFAEAVILEWYFKGIQNFLPLALSRILSGIGYVAGLYIFVRNPDDVYLVPLFYLLGLFLVIPVAYGWKKKEDRVRPSGRPLREYVPVVRKSVTIGAGGLFAQVSLYFPPLVIGLLATTADAGLFGAALRIVFFALIVDRVFIALFFPYVSRQWVEDREALGRFIRRIARWIAAGGFFVSLSLAVFASSIVELLFDEAYREAGILLAVMGWFVALTLIDSIFTTVLIATGQEKSYFGATLAGGTCAFIIIISLTYFFGITGAAAGVVLSECAMMAFMYGKFRKSFRVGLTGVLLKTVPVVLLLYAVFYHFDWRELYYAPLLAALYVGLAIALRIIDLKSVTR